MILLAFFICAFCAQSSFASPLASQIKDEVSPRLNRLIEDSLANEVDAEIDKYEQAAAQLKQVKLDLYAALPETITNVWYWYQSDAKRLFTEDSDQEHFRRTQYELLIDLLKTATSLDKSVRESVFKSSQTRSLVEAAFGVQVAKVDGQSTTENTANFPESTPLAREGVKAGPRLNLSEVKDAEIYFFANSCGSSGCALTLRGTQTFGKWKVVFSYTLTPDQEPELKLKWYYDFGYDKKQEFTHVLTIWPEDDHSSPHLNVETLELGKIRISVEYIYFLSFVDDSFVVNYRNSRGHLNRISSWLINRSQIPAYQGVFRDEKRLERLKTLGIKL